MPRGRQSLSLVLTWRTKRDLDFALKFATATAVRELAAHPNLPALYRAGIPYKREVCRASNVPGACERFLSPLQLMRERGRLGADCDDLAPWRAAELILGRHGPRDPGARAVAIPSPGIGWHVVVRRSDGTIEDPSKVLGMGKTKKAARRLVAALRRGRRRT